MYKFINIPSELQKNCFLIASSVDEVCYKKPIPGKQIRISYTPVETQISVYVLAETVFCRHGGFPQTLINQNYQEYGKMNWIGADNLKRFTTGNPEVTIFKKCGIFRGEILLPQLTNPFIGGVVLGL